MRPAPCEHGSPARFVTVVDQTRKTGHDPYGDVHGPVRIERLDALRQLQDAEAVDARDYERFTLAFLHADRCRTEQ
ncbi:hypothetical protein GCM10023085_44500 [Actinomadura viridis]|uniref:Uncharacterized protein n=1 Tax=Actinomadura viridis TaxID=58110 RepID=A0A931DNE0_9ACTN|nr:hypothetical protein [Actinomadura viridis]MBG6089813.1 hypothetical protein [Actinomadura viridis]